MWASVRLPWGKQPTCSNFDLCEWLLTIPGKWTGPARWVWWGPGRSACTVWPRRRRGRTAAAAWCAPAPVCRCSGSSGPAAARRGTASGGRWGWLRGGRGRGGWVGGSESGIVSSVFELIKEEHRSCSAATNLPTSSDSYFHLFLWRLLMKL